MKSLELSGCEQLVLGLPFEEQSAEVQLLFWARMALARVIGPAFALLHGFSEQASRMAFEQPLMADALRACVLCAQACPSFC